MMAAQPTSPFPFGDLPEGTVTFLFTDIEGSTQLLDRLRDRYALLLADQRRILHGECHLVIVQMQGSGPGLVYVNVKLEHPCIGHLVVFGNAHIICVLCR